MKRLITIFAIICLASSSFALFGMEEKYQHDADIYRLKHLEHFSKLISDYHQKTGKYPLQGESQYQHYVHIAAPHQQKYAQGGPPYKHDVTDIETFREVLEKGLERKVEFKFDPQKSPVGAPNFYIYMIKGDSFFFAVNLYSERSFANPVGKHYHKVEITNETPSRRGLWKWEDLLKDEDFQKAIKEEPYKKAWMDHLEEQYK